MSLSLRAASFGAAGLAMIGLLVLMGWGLLNLSNVTGLSGITRVQQPAPEFKLPLFDGGEVVLSGLSGKPVVINFWASWCPPCRWEAKGLEDTWRTYKNEGVVFIGVNVQDAEANAARFLSDFGVTYPNGPDADGKITVDYGVIGLPTTFFINKEGIVERRWVGGVEEVDLISWVSEMVSGSAPTGDTDGINPQGYFKLDEGR
jgi:cytochrome c biogenesis protein CcmG/thiol:disulfide interchange protein DsbE